MLMLLITKNPSNQNDAINDRRHTAEVTKPTSLGSLILWNISKVSEKNPALDIKGAIKTAQALLDRERDVSAMIPQSPEQRHLACAVLAWQQLGHNNADSLCQFIANRRKDVQENIFLASNDGTSEQASVECSQESTYAKCVYSMSFGSNSIGPVVKLPVETKIVMRMENSPSACQSKNTKGHVKDTINKIETACCLDSVCADRLTKLDTVTAELRMRAGTLAKREAERVELLERAEAAWKDLELGYQKRLTLAEEKEDDLTKQIQKTIGERNGFKHECTALALQLKEKGEKAEKDRTVLSLIEKEICERACLRLKLREESAQTEATLAEHQCRAAQLDRDLQFKEEQARRKLLNFQSELESSQTITHETERAMRAELSALREQIAQVSQQLLSEDTDTTRIKEELEDLHREKMGMVEDLEGCKAICDSRMQGMVDELNKKRDQLSTLKDTALECRCKLPVDVTVEVKRTASLAALCHCTPEDKILESCSCTSLRSQLLSNLLADLFSGLQAEMGSTGSQMPCQLLKCLEDRHNWDRASIVKTNLMNYFAQLLIGELDIAIVTSIEKYHAKWVGQSCADTARLIPDPGEAENEGWQERAIEQKAQKLATKLAEQLFQERADQLTQRAKDIVTSGPPPCHCKPQTTRSKEPAVYPVLVKSILPAPVKGPTTPANTPAFWQQTMRDVTRLRLQIEDLKKDSLKKADFKLMEEKIMQIVQRGSGTGRAETRIGTLNNSNAACDAVVKKEQKINRAVNANQASYNANLNRPMALRKKPIETNSYLKNGLNPYYNQYNGSDKTFKPYKKLGQTYAINMCMCPQKDRYKIAVQNKIRNDPVIEEYRNNRASEDSMLLMTSSLKQTKPISLSLQSQDNSIFSNAKSLEHQPCQSNCICFHKIPSNTSIDILLETLAKWKSDNNPCKTKKESESDIPSCNDLPRSQIYDMVNKKPAQDDLNITHCCRKDAENKHTCITSLNSIKKENKVPNKEESVNTTKVWSSAILDEKEHNVSKKLLDLQHKHNNAAASLNCNRGNNTSNLSKGVCVDSYFIVPAATTSEYMGAINLDKSNEDFCKCVNIKNSPDPNNEQFQSVQNASKCNTKRFKTKKDNDKNNNDGTEIQVTEEKQVGVVDKNIAVDTQKNIASKNKKNKPCGCGYDIQFLGVTLTDVKSNETEAINDKKEAEKIVMKDLDYNLAKESTEKSQPVANVIIKQMDSIKRLHKNKNTKDEFKKLLKEKNRCEKYACTFKQRQSIRESNANNILAETDVVNKEPCEFKNNFDKYDVAFKTQQTKADKGLDDQCFKDTNNEEKSCICCDKVIIDGSKDLEENTFHLIEEHLKKKLEEFKESSCNSTCIPQEEEEKLFTTILKRVKQVIKENTNKIACKCLNEKEDSKGSWNRAYGLLQEYLKTKIKRVQCSCVKEDNNSDKMLPDVLDKVCNLIENDFQRLKDVCGCKKSEVQNNDTRQANFKEVPVKDKDFFNIKNNVIDKTINSCCSQNPQTKILVTENTSTQVPACLGMVTKSCNPIEIHMKNVQTLENTQEFVKLLDTTTNNNICKKKVINGELLKTTEMSNSTYPNIVKPAKFTNLSHIAFASECSCKSLECTDYVIPGNNNTSSVNNALKKPYLSKNENERDSNFNKNPIQKHKLDETDTSILKQNEETDSPISCTREVEKNTDIELIGFNESKTNQPSQSVKNVCLCNSKSAICCRKTETANTNDAENKNVVNFSNKPYIGKTIQCSCDINLGVCVCAKSIIQADNCDMGSIMKSYLPNDKYYKNVSYIMNSSPTKNTMDHTDFLSETNGDLYLHNIFKHKTLYVSKQDGETEASFVDNEDITLKDSKEYFEMANTTTNTFDDNVSLDIEYSNSSALLGSCECCSQIPPREMYGDRLKKSIYFPKPLLGNENHFKTDIKNYNNESAPMTLHEDCDCELVPICHVKMLVENIENKLVTANCTCDSMIPNVCPIHSTKF